MRKLVINGPGALLMLVLSQAVEAAPEKGAHAKPGKQPHTVKIHGKVRGLDRAQQRNDGTIVVRDSISGQGHIDAEHLIIEGELSPGNSPGCITFGGNVTFNSSSTLSTEIAGNAPCIEYDQIDIASTLTINNATFQLVLINDFAPQYGDSFDVLNWGSLAGSGFGVVDTSAAPLPYPLDWDFSQLYLTGEVVVSVANIADGDLAPWNAPDGLINAADMMIATQLALDQRVAGALQYAHGDMNNDGVIDVVDLIQIQQLVMQN